MIDDEIAHHKAAARDMRDEDKNDTDNDRARNDPAPDYREQHGDGAPDYDPIEAGDTPEYDAQPSMEEWMQAGDIDDLSNNRVLMGKRRMDI